jgi:hypothetical protein
LAEFHKLSFSSNVLFTFRSFFEMDGILVPESSNSAAPEATKNPLKLNPIGNRRCSRGSILAFERTFKLGREIL